MLDNLVTDDQAKFDTVILSLLQRVLIASTKVADKLVDLDLVAGTAWSRD